MNHLKMKSMDRALWLNLSLAALALLSLSLYLQYHEGMKPCVLCIYERCALLGIVFAGIIGMLAPRSPLRYIAFFIWAISAGKGIVFAWQHTLLQIGEPYYKVCDLYVTFPKWLPLNKWLPEIFQSSAGCLEKQADFLMLGTSQWLIVCFITFTSFWFMFFTSQFISQKKLHY